MPHSKSKLSGPYQNIRLDALQTQSRPLAGNLQTCSRHPTSYPKVAKTVEFSSSVDGWLGDLVIIVPLCGPTCKIAIFQAMLKFLSLTRVWQQTYTKYLGFNGWGQTKYLGSNRGGGR